MDLLVPIGLLGLIGLLILLIIYILKPNYQQKFVSSTYIWKLSLKYRKKKIPINKLRNVLILLCQVLICIAAALILVKARGRCRDKRRTERKNNNRGRFREHARFLRELRRHAL